MSTIKKISEIEIIKEAADILSQMFGFISYYIKPGIKSIEIDDLAEKFLLKKNAKPAFKGYNGYPATLCISPNEKVVHGIPDDYTFKEGDLISIDGGIFYKGYYADMAYTFAIGKVEYIKQKLRSVAYKALFSGIIKIKPEIRTGDIGHAIQKHVESNGFSVVRCLTGHGIGKYLHENPMIPNYGEPNTGDIINKNMILAIEPMVNAGTHKVKLLNDNWTFVTEDLMPSAHFEHTVLVSETGYKILTSYKYIKN